jgi:hypothetical protein
MTMMNNILYPEDDSLYLFIVRYYDEKDGDFLQYFECWAENIDHAKEQCLNAYPECKIL